MKQTPPAVLVCLEEPAGVYPPEPTRPKVGEPITDTYIKALHDWVNQILGIATDDRIAWRGERRCIQKLAEDGQVR